MNMTEEKLHETIDINRRRSAEYRLRRMNDEAIECEARIERAKMQLQCNCVVRSHALNKPRSIRGETA